VKVFIKLSTSIFTTLLWPVNMAVRLYKLDTLYMGKVVYEKILAYKQSINSKVSGG
jgi:hypothetical protein